jgi:hypothetical protein
VGAPGIDANAMNRPFIPTSQAPADWFDALLAEDGVEHRGDYIGDDGFTARVMHRLPPAVTAPAWRKPAVVTLWLVAAALIALVLPGTAYEVAREAIKLFAARPFSLSTLAFVVVAFGVATWTCAALALKRD